MWNRKISEQVEIVTGFAPKDIGTTDVTSGYHSMANRGRCMAVVTTATIAATKKVTVQLKQAKDDQGTGAKNLGDKVEVTAGTGGEAFLLTTEARASDLDTANGYTHVAVTVGTDDDAPPDGAAVLVFGDLAFWP